MAEKIALITGAHGGLGTHVTKAFLGAGFTVVGVSPRIQQSDFDDPNFIAQPAALNSLDAAKRAVDTVIARYKKVDVLAHLVGGFAGGQTIAEMDDAIWQGMFDANLNSAFHILRAVIPQGWWRPHHCHWQPCRRRSRPQGWSLQRFEGSAGIADQNRRAGK